MVCLYQRLDNKMLVVVDGDESREFPTIRSACKAFFSALREQVNFANIDRWLKSI